MKIMKDFCKSYAPSQEQDPYFLKISKNNTHNFSLNGLKSSPKNVTSSHQNHTMIPPPDQVKASEIFRRTIKGISKIVT